MILFRNNLEDIAADALRDYYRVIRPSDTSRIDPQALSERVLGISIVHQKLSLNGDILGMTAPFPMDVKVWRGEETSLFTLDGRSIIIDSDLYLSEAGNSRYNYTLAHEIGHQLLFMTYPQEYGPLVLRRTTKAHYRKCENGQKITDWEEWYANTLASLILMPKVLVMKCLGEFNLPPHIHNLNDPYPTGQYRKFCQMAKHLGVSRQALAIRLQQLEVLEEPLQQRPFIRPVDITVEGEF